MANHPKLDRLVRYFEPDPAQGITPSLAKSWDISADGKVMTFHLQEGVKWHDGTPFSAADVKAHFDRIANPPTGITSPRSGWFAPVVSMEAVDDLTFRVTTEFAYPVLLDYLANGQLGIVQKKALEENDFDLSGSPDWPGTGAFRYVSHVGHETIIYERNPEYWNGTMPFLDGMEFRALAVESLGPAMVAGRIDMHRGVRPAALGIFKGEPRITVSRYFGFFDFHFHMNRTKPPFDDVRVRRAVNMVFDRTILQAGVESIWWPNFEQGSMWVPRGSAWEKDIVGDTWKTKPGFGTITDEKVNEARQLLIQAGYFGGLGTIEVENRPNLSPFFTVHGQMLEASIQKYLPGNTKFELKAVGWADGYNNIITGLIKDASMVAFSMGENDHPYNWLRGFYHSDSTQNYARYNNAEFDALMDQMAESRNRDEIVELAKQGIALLERDLPSIPTGLWSPLHDAWWDYVKGHNCENRALEMNQCIQFDTTWLDN